MAMLNSQRVTQFNVAIKRNKITIRTSVWVMSWQTFEKKWDNPQCLIQILNEVANYQFDLWLLNIL